MEKRSKSGLFNGVLTLAGGAIVFAQSLMEQRSLNSLLYHQGLHSFALSPTKDGDFQKRQYQRIS